MNSLNVHNSSECKKLFTPGPLNCSESVKNAMMRDLGSRDELFIDTVRFIRNKLLEIANISSELFTVVPIQGSGTYAIEAVLNTSTPRKNGKVLILSNGAYGKRMQSICDAAEIDIHVISFPEVETVDINVVENHLKNCDADTYTTIGIVHCETSSGLLNPIQTIGNIVKKYAPSASYFVDAMSSFGAIPIDFSVANVDFLVSSANKCLEGVPGFAFVISRTDRLLNCKGNSRSLCLDLVDQYSYLELGGQFRFTPPTHSILAFKQALIEFELEGGVHQRAKRYSENQKILREGMKRLGFKELLNGQNQSYIITAFRYPSHPNFIFEEFYKRLANLGQVIYPGKVTNADCFRIGNIGQLYPLDMKKLLLCIQQVSKDLNIDLHKK